MQIMQSSVHMISAWFFGVMKPARPCTTHFTSRLLMLAHCKEHLCGTEPDHLAAIENKAHQKSTKKRALAKRKGRTAHHWMMTFASCTTTNYTNQQGAHLLSDWCRPSRS